MSQARFTRLEDWLQWQQGLHASAIDLGLDRVRTVAQRLDLFRWLPSIFTIGGTNGKGSVVAMLEACLLSADYRVACYTSPHFIHYNERIRMDGQMASDAIIMRAFAAIDAARGDLSLTYFEFGTLAAVWCAREAGVDVLLLEVGLGGRLDACNLWDADVAVVTSIGLDHQAYLGDTREAIATEKAGIFRNGRPAICGDRQPPVTIQAHARAIGAPLSCIGDTYDATASEAPEGHWRYQGARSMTLPRPGLPGDHQLDNAATVLCALEQWSGWQAPDDGVLGRALSSVELPGRCQRWPDTRQIVLDVAHNQQAAESLADWIRQQYAAGHSPVAVVAMLDDKDHRAVIDSLGGVFRAWYVAQLTGERAGDGRAFQAMLKDSGQVVANGLVGVAQTLQRAQSDNPDCDIVVFGSFYTVAAAMAWLEEQGETCVHSALNTGKQTNSN